MGKRGLVRAEGYLGAPVGRRRAEAVREGNRPGRIRRRGPGPAEGLRGGPWAQRRENARRTFFGRAKAGSYRRRSKCGKAVYRVPLGHAVIDLLVKARWLPDRDVYDPIEVAEAAAACLRDGETSVTR
jgi:hypothetical protein